MVKECEAHWWTTDIAADDFGRTNFQRFHAGTFVYLIPDAAFIATALACTPLTLTFRCNSCAIDEEVQGALGTAVRQPRVPCTLITTYGVGVYTAPSNSTRRNGLWTN